MSSWKLRILNTRYKDAEVHLTDTQTLGRNEHKSDLVIDDPLVTDEHVKFSCSEQGVKLELLDDTLRLLVDGQAWDENQSLPPLTPIRIGELVVMVAEEDMPWPEKLPNFDQVEASSKTNVSETANQSVGGKAYKGMSVLMSIGAVALLVMAVVLYYQIKESAPAEVEPQIDLATTRSLLDADTHPHLTISWDETNRQVTLSGYVERKKDRKVLLKRMETLNIRFTSDVRTMDEIKSAAKFILKNLELDAIEIKSGQSAGSLIFVTDSNSLSAWGRAEQILQRDIPGLTSWELDIIEEKPVLEQLKELLKASSFNDKVLLEDKGDRIEVVGNLNGPEKREFKAIKQEFMKQFGSNPHLLLTAPEIKKDDSPNLNIRFRAVRLGEVPYLVLDNGQKYFEGARLPNGTRIASIQSSGIYLQSNQRTFIVNFDATL